MGGMLHIECRKCQVTRDEFVGVGRMGIGRELCACHNCHRFVLKKVNVLKSPEIENLRCPYCRRVVTPMAIGDSCPVCRSKLKVQWLGEWD